jgi:hypothetical protein
MHLVHALPPCYPEIHSSTAVNISVDTTMLSSSTCSIISGLLDHDYQFLTGIAPATNIVHLKQRTREVNNERIMQF